MKIYEIHSFQDNKIDFDIIADAIIYMRNDPMFYRKEYYPTLVKLSELHRSGKKFNAKNVLSSMITNGLNSYCKKYKLANMPDDIFNNEHRQKIFDKIYQEELKQIEKGDYT